MLLVLDCSTSGLTLALQDGANPPLSFSSPTPKSSDILHLELQQILEKAQITTASLTHVAVTTGPGSFTGVRIGLAVAQALKIVHPALNIVGLSTLQAFALQVVEQHAPTSPFTILLDAAGGSVYHQTFAPNAEPTTPATCLPLAEVASHTPTYAPASLMHPHAIALPQTISPATLLAMAKEEKFHLPAQPVYLKPLTYKPAAS